METSGARTVLLGRSGRLMIGCVGGNAAKAQPQLRWDSGEARGIRAWGWAAFRYLISTSSGPVIAMQLHGQP